ncbi:RNA cytosine C(5)-methyltransferase NSUN2-like [Dreissena polymorpha]|uniref:SAM-dependent MTase RsmB/NOP-type domain-containing protein n=1 Tax=Dreissena polymorpha TaxID=45954 RepID=A0A9D4IC68_DREPO|nr:RNA cytosine C(5)-methyltransferase NSUN2-like [Dreissena polymorpha]KAH3768184.1 hypothetical protein DPMN_169396 [Dreissena polymorpha]
MPQKPKRKPIPPNNMFVDVNPSNIETHLSQFIKYYKGINLVSEDEWKHFVESLLSELPLSFRLSARHRRCNDVHDGKGGALSESDVLTEFLKKEVLPKLKDVELDDGNTFQISALPWYPKQQAWKTNISAKVLSSNENLKPLRNFIIGEEKNVFLFRQEIVNMIPPLLVDIQPHHKVLELQAGAGFQSAQITEQIYSNPKKMPEGFLVANEKNFTKTHYRWNAGTNVLFTHHAEESFPDLYLSQEHDADSKVLYDRVFLDGTSSNDGAMRTNMKARTNWSIVQAQKNHVELKKRLRRGLELLELNGQLVYFTRSMNPLENEAVVAALIDEAPGSLQLLDVKSRLPDFHVRAGMTSWKVMSQGLVFYDTYDSAPAWFQKENEKSLFPPTNASMYNLDRCVRILPHDNDTGALFVAVITKFGSLPWQKAAEDEAKEEKMETEEKAEEKKEEEEEKKPTFQGPIRCDVNVCVAEIEWTTEITDDKQNSTETVNASKYELAPMQISKSCMPHWMQQKMQEEKFGYSEIKDANPDWEAIKKRYDIKKFDPTPYLLKFEEEGKSTQYYFCSQNVKNLILHNAKTFKSSKKFAGGMLFMKSSPSSKPELVHWGAIAIMPFMHSWLIPVLKADLVLLLESKELLFTKLSDKTKKALEALGAQDGIVYFHYEAKGKNADPQCNVMLRREKLSTFVKPCFNFYLETEENHLMRLCGITPGEEESDDEMDTM